MELRQLKYFKVIAEVKSFNRASAVLYISQPAISRQIKLLEDELEVKLFHRDGRGAQLTAAGDEFYTHVRGIDKRINDAVEATKLYSGKSDKIAIGVPPSFGAKFMANTTLEIRKLLPELGLVLVEAYSHQLVDWCHSGRLDVAIVYGNPKSSTTRTLPFSSQKLFLIKSAKRADSSEDEISFQELKNNKLLSPAIPSTTRSKLEEIAELLNVNLEFDFQVDSQSTLKRLVYEGDYQCVLPYPAVAEDVARGDLYAIEITDPCPMLELSLMIATNTRASHSLNMIVGVLHKQMDAMIESNFWQGVTSRNFDANSSG